MLLRCSLLLLCLTCVQPTEDTRDNVHKSHVTEYNSRFSVWPSIHNAATAHFLRNRRDAQEQNNVKPNVENGQTEGGVVHIEHPLASTPQLVVSTTGTKNVSTGVAEVNPNKPINGTPSVSGNATVPPSILPTTPHTASSSTVAVKIASETEKPPAKEIDLNNPGVLKRAFIVFGGFALLAVAYFIFYKRKGKTNNSNNSHSGTNDTNQFRYGVLQSSDDRRDNMELSRVPLTMESDDEEEEDLEIFDLEQKKKSLSYVNLPLHDEDIVLSPSDDRNERDNLLLDIESANSDALINWSSNSNNKSIL
ncbi:hypothetical protein K1T71_004944 [Dendrolimus kikuchii]|uniref:Uncharacterized protein n=1 Tax=Dendrolimus kikuchii TaxID=765133 RepID=A0ACC1D6S2_9NEOP|nr:hypothetical protein K1T71_004944 [Dendrolimus kikuchii]